jgi:hypothetical protein
MRRREFIGLCRAVNVIPLYPPDSLSRLNRPTVVCKKSLSRLPAYADQLPFGSDPQTRRSVDRLDGNLRYRRTRRNQRVHRAKMLTLASSSENINDMHPHQPLRPVPP